MEKKEEDSRPKSQSAVIQIDQQFMTPDFLYKQSLESETTKSVKKNNLTRQYFLSLAQLESKYHQSPVKHICLVDQLVSMYQDCVQIYDANMDPIKYYFLDKIKTLLGQADKFTQREPKLNNTHSPVKNKLK